MKKTIFIFIINFIFTILPAFSYETSKQLKIDAVNSYQPAQFVSGNVNLVKKRTEASHSNLLDDKIENSYLEDMVVNTTYENTSAIAKEKGKENAIIPINDMMEDTTLEGSVLAQEKPKDKLNGRRKWNKFCTVVKGKPSPDAILFGMWSKHFVTKERNEKNDLIALQYGGVSAGYFKNSWYKNTYFLTVARTPWRKEFKHDFSIDFQYKAGVMNGYGSHAPLRVGPVEAFLMPAFGFNYKTSGIDLWFVPTLAPVVAFNFRMGLPDKMTYESVHAKRLEKHPPKPKLVEPPSVNQYENIQKEKPIVEPASPVL